MKNYSSKVLIIGVNPFVMIPKNVIGYLFDQSKKNKGPIPVKGKLNGKPFIQHVVKYAGLWRLYLNTSMRNAANIKVGDRVDISIDFDSAPRLVLMPQELKIALSKNKKANIVFNKLAPYRQKEIKRYLNSLKTEESIVRNISKIITHLLGNGRFAGRD